MLKLCDPFCTGVSVDGGKVYFFIRKDFWIREGYITAGGTTKLLRHEPFPENMR